MTNRHPVWQLLDKIQMDAKALDRKIDELRRLMTGFELKTELGMSPKCGECGIGAGLHAAGCTLAPLLPSEVNLVGSVMRCDPPPWLAAERAAGMAPIYALFDEISAAQDARLVAEARPPTGREVITTNVGDVRDEWPKKALDQAYEVVGEGFARIDRSTVDRATSLEDSS